jgi:hypothetical protein
MLNYILLSVITYYTFDYFKLFGIFSVPGSNQTPISHLAKYFLEFNPKKPQPINLIESYQKGYRTIYGYCCRQLFKSFIENFKNNNQNKELNIAVSPIHHTSFRDIIETNFKTKNINILDIDDNYQKISIPEDKKHLNFDLIVITHLWGRYLNIDNIIKNKKDSLLVEDVVLAGEYQYEFDNGSDMLFHSCGMDKRPSSLFGAYVHIKDTHPQLIEQMVSSVSSLSLPSRSETFKKIKDSCLLYLLYNCRPIQNITKLFIRLFGLKLSDFTQQIRKSKPGFEHSKYMKCPSKLMVQTNKSIYGSQVTSELLFINKNKLFLEQFSTREIIKYFKWHYYPRYNTRSNSIYIDSFDNTKSCLPYNIIYIDKQYQQKFIDYFDSINTATIKNPTYKTFKHANESIHLFLDNLYYLPCVYNMKESEILELTEKLKKIFEVLKY